MGRYRPPVTPGSKYITPVGKEKLQQEHDYLWQEKRPQITRSVQEAAAQGDRSENAEYIYRKKELRGIDRRIRYLQKRMPDLRVVSDKPDDQEMVFFAAWVRLETETGEEVEYRIVGPDEIDHEKGNISLDSPLAQALLKKQVDDEVTIHIQQGRKTYAVIAIRY